MTFVINDNMQRLLGHLDPNKQFYLGHRLAPPKNVDGTQMKLVFNSASCYALSAGVLREYVPLIDASHACTRKHGGADDLAIAECLSSQLGVMARDTRDERARERFHVFQPATLLNVVGGIYKFPMAWYEDYNWVGTKLSVDAIAPSSVSFHFTPAGEMRALDFMLSILNKRGGVTPAEFAEELNIWPERLRGVFEEYTWAGAEAIPKLLLTQINLTSTMDVARILSPIIDLPWRVRGFNETTTTTTAAAKAATLSANKP